MRNDYSRLLWLWNKGAALLCLATVLYAWSWFWDEQGFNNAILRGLPVYHFAMWSVMLSELGRQYGLMTKRELAIFLGLPVILTPALLGALYLAYLLGANIVTKGGFIAFAVSLIFWAMLLCAPFILTEIFKKTYFAGRRR